jgi:hypothetical protein
MTAVIDPTTAAHGSIWMKLVSIPTVTYVRGEAYYAQGNYALALADFKTAVSLVDRI